VAQEVHGGRSKHALLFVGDNPGVLQPAEHLPQVLKILLFCLASYDDVIKIAEHEGKASEDPVHEALKGVTGVVLAKRNPPELEQPERHYYCRFPDVSWVHGDLVILFSQIYFGKNFAHSNPCREVQHVGQGIGVGLCHQVEVAEIAAWPPGTVALPHHA